MLRNFFQSIAAESLSSSSAVDIHSFRKLFSRASEIFEDLPLSAGVFWQSFRLRGIYKIFVNFSG
jgi:hypothetical protein